MPWEMETTGPGTGLASLKDKSNCVSFSVHQKSPEKSNWLRGRVKTVPNLMKLAPNSRLDPKFPWQTIDLDQLHHIGVVLCPVNADANVGLSLIHI